MSNVGLAGQDTVDPVTFIVTLGGFVPTAFSIMDGVCMLLGLMMVANALVRQIATAKGRGEFTTVQNLWQVIFGGVLAVIAEIIGAYGKGIFGEFENASVLFYASQDGGSLARTSMAAFLSLLQFFGAFACVCAVRVANRIATAKPQPGETWMTVFMFSMGGLALVFIQKTIGILSGLAGLPLAKFINSL